MNYQKQNGKILINNCGQFNIKQILECGQIFRFYKKDECYYVFSLDKMAKITESETFCTIESENIDYFENFFDLKTDYAQIKSQLEQKNSIMRNAIEFGNGIRILKQNSFEMIISFIISANNNIKRIKSIIEHICTKFGRDMGTYFAFPTKEQLLKATVEDFKIMGAGYRAKYLFDVLRQLENFNFEELYLFNEEECLKKLLPLAGVGPKVADCIMLFAYGKKRVFPVDTWIEKVFNLYFNKDNKKFLPNQIRKQLINIFENLSGYAQQYLFYYQRELKI